MISDDDLYSLAIFLGSLAMLLTIVYHFLEVNAIEDVTEEARSRGGSISGKKDTKGSVLSEDRKRDVGVAS